MDNRGQSLVEIVIALFIFTVAVVSLASLGLTGLAGLERGRESIQARGLATEGYEAIRAIKSRAWNEIIYGRSEVELTAAGWRLEGEGATGQIGDFSRTIDFSPVYRGANGAIVDQTDAGAYLDVLSKSVSVAVGWDPGTGQTRTITIPFEITAWNANTWEQSDWSAGSGQIIWLDPAAYSSDDGNIEAGSEGVTLKEISTTTFATGGWLESSAYDAGRSVSFVALAWEQADISSCPGCSVKAQIKTAPDVSGSPGEWSATWSGPEGEDGEAADYFTINTGELINSDHNGNEWIKYRLEFAGDGTASPVLNSIKIYYQ